MLNYPLRYIASLSFMYLTIPNSNLPYVIHPCRVSQRDNIAVGVNFKKGFSGLARGEILSIFDTVILIVETTLFPCSLITYP